jgi:glycosyltransferase involved in cell wall biosynthesis
MKKHVLMLAYTLYSIDARIRREAETLVSHGYKVKIFVPREKGKPRNYELDGVEVSELSISKYQGKSNLRYLLSYIWFTIAASLKCNCLFFRKQLDVLHVHNMPNFLIFAGLLPRLFGVKTILDIHDSMPETYSTKFDKSHPFLIKMLCWEEAVCCRLANRIICVNHPQKDTLAGRGIPGDKIHILMNVPDHKRFNLSEKGKYPGNDSGSFNLVYHGTQARRLGVDFPIRAVARLRGKLPGLKFCNYGSGDDLEEFINLSKELGIEKSVYFSKTDFPIEDLPEILSKMDVGIVANRKNAATALMLPVKMLEYISLDIPVIAPRLPTIQYYFTEEMVTFFEPENIDSLADAILELYKNPEKRKSQVVEARKFITSYGWENHQFDLINLYKKL